MHFESWLKSEVKFRHPRSGWIQRNIKPPESIVPSINPPDSAATPIEMSLLTFTV